MTMEDLKSHIHAPKGFNINTVLAIVVFVVNMLVLGGGMVWGYSSLTHTVNTQGELFEKRIALLESSTRAIDNLTYRLTQAERNAELVTTVMASFQEAMSDMSGDMKVMREIMQRLERQVSAQPTALLLPALRP